MTIGNYADVSRNEKYYKFLKDTGEVSLINGYSMPVIKARGDGSCFYNAILNALGININKVDKFKKFVKNSIINDETFKEIYENTIQPQGFDGLINRLSTPNEWAEITDIFAVERATGLSVAVIKSDNKDFLETCSVGDVHKNNLWITYHGEHYDTFRTHIRVGLKDMILEMLDPSTKSNIIDMLRETIRRMTHDCCTEVNCHWYDGECNVCQQKFRFVRTNLEKVSCINQDCEGYTKFHTTAIDANKAHLYKLVAENKETTIPVTTTSTVHESANLPQQTQSVEQTVIYVPELPTKKNTSMLHTNPNLNPFYSPASALKKTRRVDLKQKFEFNRLIKKKPKVPKNPYNTKLSTVDETEDTETSVSDVVNTQSLDEVITSPVTQPNEITITHTKNTSMVMEKQDIDTILSTGMIMDKKENKKKKKKNNNKPKVSIQEVKPEDKVIASPVTQPNETTIAPTKNTGMVMEKQNIDTILNTGMIMKKKKNKKKNKNNNNKPKVSIQEVKPKIEFKRSIAITNHTKNIDNNHKGDCVEIKQPQVDTPEQNEQLIQFNYFRSTVKYNKVNTKDNILPKYNGDVITNNQKFFRQHAKTYEVDNMPYFIKNLPEFYYANNTNKANRHNDLAVIRKIFEQKNYNQFAEYSYVTNEYHRECVDVGGGTRFIDAGIRCTMLWPTLSREDISRIPRRNAYINDLIVTKQLGVRVKVTEQTFQDYAATCLIDKRQPPLYNLTDVVYYLEDDELIMGTENMPYGAVMVGTMHLFLQSGEICIGENKYGDVKIETDNIHMSVIGNMYGYTHKNRWPSLITNDSLELEGRDYNLCVTVLDRMPLQATQYVRYVITKIPKNFSKIPNNQVALIEPKLTPVKPNLIRRSTTNTSFSTAPKEVVEAVEQIPEIHNIKTKYIDKPLENHYLRNSGTDDAVFVTYLNGEFLVSDVKYVDFKLLDSTTWQTGKTQPIKYNYAVSDVIINKAIQALSRKGTDMKTNMRETITLLSHIIKSDVVKYGIPIIEHAIKQTLKVEAAMLKLSESKAVAQLAHFRNDELTTLRQGLGQKILDTLFSYDFNTFKMEQLTEYDRNSFTISKKIGSIFGLNH